MCLPPHSWASMLPSAQVCLSQAPDGAEAPGPRAGLSSSTRAAELAGWEVPPPTPKGEELRLGGPDTLGQPAASRLQTLPGKPHAPCPVLPGDLGLGHLSSVDSM